MTACARLAMVWLLGASGCQAATPVDTADSTTAGTDGGSVGGSTGVGSDSGGAETSVADDSTGSSDGGSSSTGGDEGESSGSTTGLPDAVDCAALPSEPISVTTIAGARGYHGLVITPDGDIIGSDETSLIRSTYDGDWSVFAPGVGAGEQMQWLPEGDFAFVVDVGLSRVGLDATLEVVHPDVPAYGIALGPDGQIWAATESAVYRVDRTTGERSQVLAGVGGALLRTIGFSPDDTRVYVGTTSADGVILAADLDEAGEPSTPLTPFVTGVGTEGKVFSPNEPWHDTLEVDACGNLYVSDFHTWTVYRISPAGEVASFWFSQGLLTHAHAMVWGTGAHGWRDDAVYATQPYNDHAVIEIVLGVPSREFEGTVLNAAD